jgi:hypothetical protein
MRLYCEESFFTESLVPGYYTFPTCSQLIHYFSSHIRLHCSSPKISYCNLHLILIYSITKPNTSAPTIAASAPITPFLPVCAAAELDFAASAEEVVDPGGEEADAVVPFDAGDEEADAADVEEGPTELTALAAVTTPPSTFWGITAFALAEADLYAARVLGPEALGQDL